MSKTFFLRGVVLLLASTCLAQAQAPAGKFIEVRSPNFILTTDAGEKRALDAAWRFEIMRRVFATLIPRQQLNLALPLRVVAFADTPGYLLAAPAGSKAGAVLLGGDDRQFLILNLASERAFEDAFREYGRLLLERNFPKVPSWFDEGFTEFFATVTLDATSVRLGAAPRGVATMLGRGLQSSAKFLVVDLASSVPEEQLTEAEAQSWLLWHYLYSERLIVETAQMFERMQNQKMPLEQAMQQSLKMTPAQLDTALAAHWKAGPKVETRELPATVEVTLFAKPKIKPRKVAVLLADIHLHDPERREQAGKEFARLIEEDKLDPAAHFGLGYYHWLKEDGEGAAKPLASAAELNSPDPRAFYYHALRIYTDSGSVPKDAETLVELTQSLDQAIRLDETYAQAYDLKAAALAVAGNHAGAIQAERLAVANRPRDHRYLLNLAKHYLNAERFDDAKTLLQRLTTSHMPKVAEEANQMVGKAETLRTSPLMRTAERSNTGPRTAAQWEAPAGSDIRKDLEDLELRQKGHGGNEMDVRGIKHINGVIEAVECQYPPVVTLIVRAGKTRWRFHAEDAKKILLVGKGRFSCGLKQRRVAVNYKEAGPTSGDIVSLEIF